MKMLRWSVVCASLVASVAAAEVPRISPAEAAKQVASGQAVLVDVREPKEWAETGVAAPAVLLSKSDFDGRREVWGKFLADRGGKAVIVYCRTGRRSEAVAEKLAQEGVPVSNAGGFSDWKEAGLPTRKVEPTHSAP